LVGVGSVLADNGAAAEGGLFNYSIGTGSVTESCILHNQAVAVKPDGFGNGVENDNDTPLNAAGNWWGVPPGPGNDITPSVKADSVLAVAPAICSGSSPTPFPTPGKTGNQSKRRRSEPGSEYEKQKQSDSSEKLDTGGAMVIAGDRCQKNS